MPAVFASGSNRPSRSTTPRSHSLMMYNEFQTQISPRPTISAIPTNPISMFSSRTHEILISPSSQPHQPHQEHGENCKRYRPRKRNAYAYSSWRERRTNQKNRAQKHRDHAPKSQDTVTGHFCFQDEKHQRQDNQEEPCEIHRQEIKRVQCQDQTNPADHTGQDDSGMSEFGVEAQYSENQQNENDIRLHDPRKKFLPRGEFKGLA